MNKDLKIKLITYWADHSSVLKLYAWVIIIIRHVSQSNCIVSKQCYPLQSEA